MSRPRALHRVRKSHPSGQTETLESSAELRRWLELNWEADLTVGEWWARLGPAGWAVPSLPLNTYGRGLSYGDGLVVRRQIESFGAIGGPAGIGVLLAAPTIATHGSPDQIERYLPDLVSGRTAWCQLFSEPGAGSDLAGLTTKAVRDGDEWVISGQKVWTSFGDIADHGMLLARTAPELPKHSGLTWFVMEMDQPGVELRPLREMTGHSMFNEVFLSEARVRADAAIGGVNNGWVVANTTLRHERAGLGAGGAGGGLAVMPGNAAGQLARRVREVASSQPVRVSSAETTQAKGRPSAAAKLHFLAQDYGRNLDPVIRQKLAQLHILEEVAQYNARRLKDERGAGRDIPGMANIAKLSKSRVVGLQRDLSLDILGARGTLHGYTSIDRDVLVRLGGDPSVNEAIDKALYAQAPSIYGGTDQIQLNILGERILKLPKEPSPDWSLPFAEVLRNAWGSSDNPRHR